MVYDITQYIYMPHAPEYSWSSREQHIHHADYITSRFVFFSSCLWRGPVSPPVRAELVGIDCDINSPAGRRLGSCHQAARTLLTLVGRISMRTPRYDISLKPDDKKHCRLMCRGRELGHPLQHADAMAGMPSKGRGGASPPRW